MHELVEAHFMNLKIKHYNNINDIPTEEGVFAHERATFFERKYEGELIEKDLRKRAIPSQNQTYFPSNI